MTSVLEIRGLRAEVGGTEILRGIDLTVRSGEVHAVMGPNGAGKSTLSAVVMGKPGYTVTAGSVMLDGVDVLAMPAWQRAALRWRSAPTAADRFGGLPPTRAWPDSNRRSGACPGPRCCHRCCWTLR